MNCSPRVTYAIISAGGVFLLDRQGPGMSRITSVRNPPRLAQRAPGPFGPGTPKESEKSPKGVPGPGPKGPGALCARRGGFLTLAILKSEKST